MADPTWGRKTSLLLLCSAVADPTLGFDSCMLLGFDRGFWSCMLLGFEPKFWSCILFRSAIAGSRSKSSLLFNFLNLGFGLGFFNSFFQIGFFKLFLIPYFFGFFNLFLIPFFYWRGFKEPVCLHNFTMRSHEGLCLAPIKGSQISKSWQMWNPLDTFCF